MYADEKDLRGLFAITLAAFLLLSLKLGALVQYFQQTHHVFLQVNPNAASADWFHLTDEIETARDTIRSIQLETDQRLITAGQIIVLGDAAIPKPEIPTCPVIDNAAQNCPVPNVDQPNPTSTENIAETIVKPTGATIKPEANVDPVVVLPMADPSLSQLADTDTPIELHAGDKVLLVGDSMMQGLGPHIVSSLSRNNGVQTLDLSRHSTGLAYPSYYDWPNTILQKLQSEKFKLLMIFIGANDTWDIVINGKYTSFGHPKWVDVYSERVENIILTAKAYNTRIIWLGAPPMGREKMVDRIPVLNQIFESTTAKYPGVARYVPTANSLTTDGKTFSKFIEIPSRGKVMVRANDGVHFTASGQRLLAQLALSQLVLHPFDKKSAEKNNFLSSSSASSTASSTDSISSESSSSNSASSVASESSASSIASEIEIAPDATSNVNSVSSSPDSVQESIE